MSFITNRMLGIVLVMVFAGILTAGSMKIMAQAKEQTQELTSNRLNISDAETFEQMIAQNTLSAYSCTKNPTAFTQTLMNWEQYKNQYDLQKLREAGSDMKCQGSTFSIPFSGGAQDVNGVSWNDDEEGQYSKQKFVFKERVSISQVPNNDGRTIHQKIVNKKKIDQNQVLIAHNDRKETYIYWILMPPDIRNRYTVPKGISMDEPFRGGLKTKAMTVTVIGHQNFERSGETFDDHRDNNVNSDELIDDRRDPVYSYVFCEGTKGYIKTYTGDNAKSNVENYGPPYTVENPPGENQEKASDHENVLHPFIVITENTCGNNVDAPGVDRASFLNGVDEYDQGSVKGTEIKMTVHDGNSGYFPGLDFVSEKQNKLGTFRYVQSSASGGRCRVTVSDASLLGGSKTFVYSEGHVITQKGPIETGVEAETAGGNTIEAPNGDNAQANILFSKFDPVSTGELTRELANIRGNYWRRVAGNPSPLASQRAFFSPDGSLSKKRFMFRPEGDILCGDLRGGNSEVNWVMCAPGNGNSMDGKVATANGDRYVCEIDSNYKDTGVANWNLKSSSFQAQDLKSSYSCQTDSCGLRTSGNSLMWRPGQTSGYDRVEWSIPNDKEKRVVIDMDVKRRGHLQIGAKQQGETGTSYINLGQNGGEGIYIDHGIQYHQIGTYPVRGCIEGRCNSGNLKLELTWKDDEVTWTVLGRGGSKIHSSTEAFNDIDKIFFETWQQDSQQPVVEIQQIKIKPVN